MTTYTPIFSKVSDGVSALFKFKDLLGFAKMLSFVTSVVHCVNEAVVITVLKHMAINQLGASITATVGTGEGAGVSGGGKQEIPDMEQQQAQLTSTDTNAPVDTKRSGGTNGGLTESLI